MVMSIGDDMVRRSLTPDLIKLCKIAINRALDTNNSNHRPIGGVVTARHVKGPLIVAGISKTLMQVGLL